VCICACVCACVCDLCCCYCAAGVSRSSHKGQPACSASATPPAAVIAGCWVVCKLPCACVAPCVCAAPCVHSTPWLAVAVPSGSACVRCSAYVHGCSEQRCRLGLLPAASPSVVWCSWCRDDVSSPLHSPCRKAAAPSVAGRPWKSWWLCCCCW